MRENKKLTLLTVADLHAWSADELELIRGLEYDCCCLLGDIPEAAIEIIRGLIHKPIFGVHKIQKVSKFAQQILSGFGLLPKRSGG